MPRDPLDLLSKADGDLSPRWDSCPGPRCPDPDLIWRAARGQLDRAETKSLLSDVSRCEVCVSAWRAALDASGDVPPLGLIRSADDELAEPRRTAIVITALGALAILTVALIWWFGGISGPAPEPEPLIWSDATAATNVMAREDFFVSWTGSNHGKVIVEVYDGTARGVSDPEPIVSIVADASEGEVRIPAEALAAIPKSALVTVRRPDDEDLALMRMFDLVD